jgi:hypothetical protein
MAVLGEGTAPTGAADFVAPDAAPQRDFTQAPDYEAKKAAALQALEPPSPVSDNQRFDVQTTNYDDPDKDPGVVNWKIESGGGYNPGLIQEATTVERSREYIHAAGAFKAAERARNAIGKDLRPEVNAGWRGTSFDDLDGVARELTAKTERVVEVEDAEGFREGMGERFPDVAERSLTMRLRIPEGYRLRGGIPATPEALIAIFQGVLERNRFGQAMQEDRVTWKTETYVTDLDVLRELIEADEVPLDTLKISRKVSLTPDVAPSERTPQPNEQAILGGTSSAVRAD